MKITSLSVSQYGREPEGSFIVSSADVTLNIKLTADEAHQVQALAIRFFNDRQQTIANSVADMSVPLLGAPPQEAEFTEVEAPPAPLYDPSDDVPF